MRWRVHFVEVMIRPVPEVTAEVVESDEVKDSIDTGGVTRDEIRQECTGWYEKRQGARYRCCYSRLSAFCVFHELFDTVWEEESVPEDRGLIVKPPKKGDLTSCKNS